MIRVADYVMKRIYGEGVEHLFYVPGGQCVYLMDALRRTEELQGVGMHHEQSAAMAALTYAKYNQKLGACLVTTGCAGTNTLTGVLHAWQDSVPCIVISGQQSYGQTIKASGLPLRQVGVQEADIETLVKPITKYVVTISDAKEIAYHLDKALYEATHGRKGPVWIDIPLDIQNAMVEEEQLMRFEGSEEKPTPSAEDIAYVCQCLSEAERPIILAGGGVRGANGADKLKAFVRKYNIPTVFTRLSSDMLPYDDECNMGVVSGLAGASRYGNFAIQNSDLVISIGCRLSSDTTGSEREKFAREAKIVVVDIDEVEHSKKGVKIERFIKADACMFLEEASKMQVACTWDVWRDKCKHWKRIFGNEFSLCEEENKIDAKYFMCELSKAMPEKSIVISDAGFTGASAPAANRLKESDRMIHSHAQGEMGYSLPAACGAATLAEGTVIAYTGDGSFMMNLQELQTVVRNHYNIKIIIMNNNGYSGVRHGQKAHFRGKSIGTDPSNGIDFPEYEKIASAFGIRYMKIQSLAEMREKIRDVFTDESPLICEVMSDPEQFDLHNGLVTYGKRKFGFRPIEDQSPFLERGVFFEEMIVEPLEMSFGKPV